MKKILVPTDFSKCAGSAIKYALEMAASSGAEVICMHSVSPYEGIDVDGSGLLWVKEYQQAKAKSLETWIKKFKRTPAYSKVNIRTICNIGFTVTDISEKAEEEKVDLIVMGTTGTSGMEGMLFGSIAGGVISKTNTPTLLIPQSAKFSTKTSFGLATDFKINCGKESIQLLNEILKVHEQDQVKVVHVLPEAESKPGAQDEKKITSTLKGLKLSFHYLHDKNISNAIDNFIEASGVGFLCAISHKHTYMYKMFHGSTTKKLAFQAHTPLLVLYD